MKSVIDRTVVRLIESARHGLERSASPALPAQAPDLAQPDHVDRPRAGLLRGRHAQGEVPALSRGESQGRHRADHDRRLGRGRRGLARGLRQPAGLQGRDRALAQGTDRRVSRARGRGHDPADPPGPAHRLEQGRLAAGAVALHGARAGPPVVSQGRRGLGPGPHRRALRRGRPAHAGRRHGRHRDRGLRPLYGRLLVAGHQQARRRLRRQPGKPPALHLPGARVRAQGGRAGLHLRPAPGGRRGLGARAVQGGGPGDRPAPGGDRPDRFPQRDPRPYRERRGA